MEVASGPVIDVENYAESAVLGLGLPLCTVEQLTHCLVMKQRLLEGMAVLLR